MKSISIQATRAVPKGVASIAPPSLTAPMDTRAVAQPIAVHLAPSVAPLKTAVAKLIIPAVVQAVVIVANTAVKIKAGVAHLGKRVAGSGVAGPYMCAKVGNAW